MMNDPLDVNQEIKETGWLGAALAGVGSLTAAGAAVLVVLMVDIGHEPPHTWRARLVVGFLTVLFACMGGFGVKTFLRGVSIMRLRSWVAALDVRDALVSLAARFLGDDGYRKAGLSVLPRHLAPVTIHDLPALGVDSAESVLRMVDTCDLEILLRVHGELFDLLETLVRNDRCDAHALHCLRQDSKARAPRWRDYRASRDQVTHVIRSLAHLDKIPELVTSKPC